MRPTTIILCALVALCSGLVVPKQVKYADKDFLVKQKFVFDVLQHVHQDYIYGHKYDDLKNYKIWEHLDNYNKPEQVEDFVDYYTHHPLPVEEIFSIFEEHHEKYAEGLVHTIYLAKDFETYKKTVLWARYNVNKHLFVYALHVATLARPDMQGIVFPAIYEIFPHYFFTTETIQRAQHYKMQGFQGLKKIEDVYTVAIPTNYTGVYGNVNDDNLLSYFTEDIGLNAFYYYYNIDYPYWTHGKPEAPLKNDRRGEFYLFLHWQILARYYLERLSHDMCEIEEYHYYTPMHTGYHTGLRYYNGMHFPNRDNHYNFYNSENYHLIDIAHLYEHRILNAIDLGHVYLPDHSVYKFKDVQDGVEILGNILQGNEDSVNTKYYGHYDQQLRYIVNEGISYGKYEHTIPGVLMHYETSMRDPAFYQIYKQILSMYRHYIQQVPPYTERELGFEGVKVEGVEVDKLVTYYDKYDSDISNAVDVEPVNEAAVSDLVKFGRVSHYDGQSFVVKARQYRLNHLPYTVKTTVTSNKQQKASVKVYIGPKYDCHGHKIHLQDNGENFFLLDNYVVDLVPGKNVLVRNSDGLFWYVNDRTTYYELYKRLLMATKSDSYKFPLDMSEAHCGFPNRLTLPKGKKGGMPYQIFVIVSPYHAPKVPQFTGYDPVVSCGIGSGSRYLQSYPFGYPFDRKIDTTYWHLENMCFQDIMVYHKTESDVNAVHH